MRFGQGSVFKILFQGSVLKILFKGYVVITSQFMVQNVCRNNLYYLNALNRFFMILSFQEKKHA